MWKLVVWESSQLIEWINEEIFVIEEKSEGKEMFFAHRVSGIQYVSSECRIGVMISIDMGMYRATNM